MKNTIAKAAANAVKVMDHLTERIKAAGNPSPETVQLTVAMSQVAECTARLAAVIEAKFPEEPLLMEDYLAAPVAYLEQAIQAQCAANAEARPLDPPGNAQDAGTLASKRSKRGKRPRR